MSELRTRMHNDRKSSPNPVAMIVSGTGPFVNEVFRCWIVQPRRSCGRVTVLRSRRAARVAVRR